MVVFACVYMCVCVVVGGGGGEGVFVGGQNKMFNKVGVFGTAWYLLL